ncbi:glycosyltransferase family 2 protein [Pseudomonas sp. EYE_354]|uniref:glycosyltransferase family 2 protein n=1 Tax=Pseudomonas sp. EYE_354 TaxID=2853449 RepID=UPI00200303B4|nr:glycosyltransferase family 2 protein [Pseudomonas sp. EYE_354]MCK6186794.1 glycosyltransferase [Pseudomonas sp. EYE_354]
MNDKAQMSLPTYADVSVVIPCYRCKDTIRRALDSVYSQTLRPSEIILVEDASGDGTLEFLELLVKDYPGGWLRVIPLSSNCGPGTARNTGWDKSKNRYVAFLDSDDSWHPQKLEIQYGWMERNPDFSLTGQIGIVVDGISNDALKSYKVDDYLFDKVSKTRLLLSNKFSTPSVLLKRDIAIRFSAGKRFCEDYELWCRLICAGYICATVNIPLTFCYKPLYGHAGLSGDLWGMEKGELDVYNVLRKYGYIGLTKSLILKGWSLIRYWRRALMYKYLSQRT